MSIDASVKELARTLGVNPELGSTQHVLYKCLMKTKELQERLSNLSWERNPDRMGGSYSQSEVDSFNDRCGPMKNVNESW